MTNGEQMRVYDALMERTAKELRNFAKRHGVCLGYDGSTKRGIAMRITDQLNYEQHEYDIVMSMVDTPSSYAEVQ